MRSPLTLKVLIENDSCLIAEIADAAVQTGIGAEPSCHTAKSRVRTGRPRLGPN